MSKSIEVETHHEGFAKWWNSLGETHPHSKVALAELAFMAGIAFAAALASTRDEQKPEDQKLG